MQAISFQTITQWIGIAVILGALANVIANTGNEPRLATLMVSISIFIVLWISVAFYKNSDSIVNAGFIVVVLSLLAGFSWIIDYIWRKN